VTVRVKAATWLLFAGLFAAQASRAQAPMVTTNPNAARLVTSDVTNFWDVLEHANDEDLEELLQRDYLDRGTVGLHDFIPGRILSAGQLARRIRTGRADYEAARANSLKVIEATPAIRAAFKRFKELYPQAIFPDVYFVIGRFNSGGTASENGLLIGAEMADPESVHGIIAHELTHFQQVHLKERPTLLQQAFREGSADFMQEMVTGVRANQRAQDYGRKHEHELWVEFRQQMAQQDYSGWMYSDATSDRPKDLGYFIGYRIAEAFYNHASDKRAAIRDIVRAANVPKILSKSGYDP
jgi:hypothetical protein